jgi:1-acyl-sn-glycerol-3-phosphate acyltransferase
VIVNHQSTLDIVWFCAITPNRLGAVGKRELIWVPIFNLSWWALRFFFIDRSNLESAISTLERAAENTLMHHRSVALSPEGTRSPDGRILPFKKGVFHLAMMGRFPLYPIVVCGAAEAMPKHALWARPHPISLRFLPPISTQDWDPHRLSEHIDFVRQQMIDAYDELREEAGLQPLSHERF